VEALEEQPEIMPLDEQEFRQVEDSGGDEDTGSEKQREVVLHASKHATGARTFRPAITVATALAAKG
jgi:hypothetical protein